MINFHYGVYFTEYFTEYGVPYDFLMITKYQPQSVDVQGAERARNLDPTNPDLREPSRPTFFFSWGPGPVKTTLLPPPLPAQPSQPSISGYLRYLTLAKVR